MLGSTTVTSAVLPGSTQERTGTPCRVTVMAITACGLRGRSSLRRPRRRGAPRRCIVVVHTNLDGGHCRIRRAPLRSLQGTARRRRGSGVRVTGEET